MIKNIKTPTNRFENLPDYPFSANYMEVGDGLNMHYLDEGNKEHPTVLLLHGEPSWSYLYRKMIPVLVAKNFRVIAPDLIGFGKSDKPVEQNDYSYQKHIDWVKKFFVTLALDDVILFCQDWGGLIGLRMVAEMSDNFSMVVASNTALPTGNQEMPKAFHQWRAFSQKSPDFDIGQVIQMGTVGTLSDEVIAAYNAPFPSEEYKAGARIFPTLVPYKADDPESIKNTEAWKKLMQWEKPFITIFGSEDKITAGGDKAMQKLIPGAKGQKHSMLHAGHFIQEEVGDELAELLVEFYKSNKAI